MVRPMTPASPVTVAGEARCPARWARSARPYRRRRGWCMLAVVDDPFDYQALRIQQPGKWLPNRARYEIMNDQRQLLAIATETEAHTRLKLLSKSLPDARVLEVTT